MVQNPMILIRTEFGDITIQVYSDRAPITAANFLRYVDEQRYQDSSFYRVVRLDNQPNDAVKIQVIQGGLGMVELGMREPAKRLPPIPHETNDQTGILHKDGTVSMARLKPGSASSEFFICIDDQPELDFGGKRNPDGQGFAAFGQVMSGMAVVRQIQQLPTNGQILTTRVRISQIVRV